MSDLSSLTALLTAIAAVFAALISWFVPMRLRQEKLKEILYQKKLAVWEQFFTHGSKLFYLTACVQYAEEDSERFLYKKQLLDCSHELQRTVEGATHILPEEIHMLLSKILKLRTSAELLVQEETPDRELKAYADAVAIARADLEVKKFSPNIEKVIASLYYPPTNIFM